MNRASLLEHVLEEVEASRAEDEPVHVLAKRIACAAHQGQTRRDGVTPYIQHPADVALRVDTDAEKAVAWLHDVLEDTPITAYDLLTCGIPSDLVGAVVVLTKHTYADTQEANANDTETDTKETLQGPSQGAAERSAGTYMDFITRIVTNPLAMRVKKADIESNLADDPTDKQRKKYAEALAVLDAFTIDL